MKIDENLVLKLESLARLNLSAEERVSMINDLNKMLDMVDEINAFDVEDTIALMKEAGHLGPREDRVVEGMQTLTAMSNAPARSGNYFLLPRIIETDE